jgi:two-component system, LytTR family, response regulator
MEQYTAIIIDDEINVREALSLLLNQYCPEITVLGILGSAEEGRLFLKENKVDFIFLDIAMPKEDGFTFLRTIPNDDYIIIFTTAFQEYALRALKANAIDYLMKPVNPFELQNAVTKAIHHYKIRHNQPLNSEVYNQSLDNLKEQIQARRNVISRITISEQNGFQIVDLSEVMYMRGEGNYTTFHLEGGRQITSTRTLGEYEKILEGSKFLRIHRSEIINLKFLIGYTCNQGNFAVLKGGISLDISRRKLNEFREAIKQHSFLVE